MAGEYEAKGNEADKIMKRWTIKDIEYLRRNYPKYPARVLALQMDLPQKNVEWAIRYNEIRKPKKPRKVSSKNSERVKFEETEKVV